MRQNAIFVCIVLFAFSLVLNAADIQGNSRQFDNSLEDTRSVDTFPWSDDFSIFDTNFWTLTGADNWQHMPRLDYVYCDFFHW